MEWGLTAFCHMNTGPIYQTGQSNWAPTISMWFGAYKLGPCIAGQFWPYLVLPLNVILGFQLLSCVLYYIRVLLTGNWSQMMYWAPQARQAIDDWNEDFGEHAKNKGVWHDTEKSFMSAGIQYAWTQGAQDFLTEGATALLSDPKVAVGVVKLITML